MKNVLNLHIALLLAPFIFFIFGLNIVKEASDNSEYSEFSSKLDQFVLQIETTQNIEELRNLSKHSINYIKNDLNPNTNGVDFYINIFTQLLVFSSINLGIAIFIRIKMYPNNSINRTEKDTVS